MTTIAHAVQALQTPALTRLDAQRLLLHALGRATTDRAWLLAHDGDAVPQAAALRLADLAQRHAAGEPMGYLLGEQEFYGLGLQVDARVLVPRPDTETLVDWALEVLAQAPVPNPRVIDLGTGSGAIALALKATRPALQVHAVDASPDALAVAMANGQRLGLAVQWLHGSWLGPLACDGAAPRFDAIVSNPPYIPNADPHLAALTHEPLQALASGGDGLDDIRLLIAQAPAHLKAGGWLLLEHGYDQAAAVRALLQRGGFEQVQSRTDLGQMERCSGGQHRPATVQAGDQRCGA